MTEQMITETAVAEIAEETKAFEEAFEAAETVAEPVTETVETPEEIQVNPVEPVAEKVDGRKNNGRKSTYSDRTKKLAALLALRDGEDAVAADGTKAEKPKSRYLEKELAAMGLVKFETQPVPGQKGRPKHIPVLTGQGKSVLASMLKKAARDAEKETTAA